ncbi:MAG: flagellar hook-basal body complex protein FliE [Sphingopyxis sp.]
MESAYFRAGLGKVKLTDINQVMAIRSQIIGQNDALSRAAGRGVGSADEQGRGVEGFGAAMRAAISEVDASQHQAAAASEAYERGETTDIAGVMMARQQASINFEATLQVRNKLLSAYGDIMNMPV